MAPSDFVRIIRKYWALLVCVTVVGAGLGALLSFLQTPSYSSSTRVFVSVRSGDSTAELAEGVTFSLSRVASYATLANSQRVLDDAIASLGIDDDYASLHERVSATIVPDTTIIEITTSSDSAQEAADLADAVAASLTETVGTIETGPGLTSPVELALVQAAVVPTVRDAPSPVVYMAIGGVVGLLLAIGIAALRLSSDTRIRSERDIRDVTEAPVLGAIAFDPKAKRRPLVVHSHPHSQQSESFRALRTSLQFIKVDSARTFVVTSTMPGDGKSTTVANLALALADAGRSVVLVDADLRDPRVAEYMNLDGTVGLTDVLIGEVPLGDAVQPWGATSLSVLPAGEIPPNPSELLDSHAMVALIAQLQAEFDWVLLDAPPLLPVTDAVVLSKHVDGLIVVASAGRTTKHQLTSAVQLLQTVDSEVSGVVLTMVPTRGADAQSTARYGLSRHGRHDLDRRQGERAAEQDQDVLPAPLEAQR